MVFFLTNPKISIADRKELATGDRFYEKNMNGVRKTEGKKKRTLRILLAYDVLPGWRK